MREIYMCACGATPERLDIQDNGQGRKWASATCGHCGLWSTEFRTDYHDFDSDECQALAVDAWNSLERWWK